MNGSQEKWTTYTHKMHTTAELNSYPLDQASPPVHDSLKNGAINGKKNSRRQWMKRRCAGFDPNCLQKKPNDILFGYESAYYCAYHLQKAENCEHVIADLQFSLSTGIWHGHCTECKKKFLAKWEFYE
jgi:hypothetical protein